MMATQPRPVLVADRDDRTRNRLTEALRREGFDALGARTGGEAVEVARNRVVAISVLDWALPDLSGIETYRLITSLYDGVEAIFLSQERSKDTLVRLLDEGVFTVLHKPPRIDVFLRAVHELDSRLGREERD
ncbi:MAG: response regulator [Planctomycetota bacterium]